MKLDLNLKYKAVSNLPSLQQLFSELETTAQKGQQIIQQIQSFRVDLDLDLVSQSDCEYVAESDHNRNQ